MERTGVCVVCGKTTGSQNGQHFTSDGIRCDACKGKTIRMKTWTGPTHVTHDADLLRGAGLNVVCEGTEHVYLDIEASNSDDAIAKIIQKMMERFDTVWGMRFSPVR